MSKKKSRLVIDLTEDDKELVRKRAKSKYVCMTDYVKSLIYKDLGVKRQRVRKGRPFGS